VSLYLRLSCTSRSIRHRSNHLHRPRSRIASASSNAALRSWFIASCDGSDGSITARSALAVLLGMATIRRCAEVVVAPGPDPRPLGGRTPVQPELATLGTPTLRPTLRRVLPELLPTVDGPIQQPVRRCHHFVAAAAGPVGLEDLVPVSEIASQDAEVPICDQPVHGVLRHRVPGNGIAHEVAIPRDLLVYGP